MRNLFVAALVAAALAVAVAGCGGDDEQSAGPTDELVVYSGREE